MVPLPATRSARLAAALMISVFAVPVSSCGPADRSAQPPGTDLGGTGLEGTDLEGAGPQTAAPLGAAGSIGPLVVPRTEKISFESSIQGVRYELLVALPHSHADGGGPYPLLLLLDAHYSFLVARNVMDHMSEREDLPEAVVVGVGYPGRVDRASDSYRNHRTRDYTPTHVPTGGYGPEHQRHSGGGPTFQRVIAEEVVPLLEERYRLDGRRALVGHSYGGLFAVSVMLDRPQLFDGIVAISPSLWYDDHLVLERRDLKSSLSSREPPLRVYLGVGSREINGRRNMVTDLQLFAQRLRDADVAGVAVRSEVLDDETHNSVFPRALSNGLRWIYESR